MIETARTWLLLRRLRDSRRPRPALRALQDRLLRSAVAHAAAEVPFYRRLWSEAGVAAHRVRSIEDLERLPILYPAQVRAAAGNGELRAAARPSQRDFPTSGSSGAALRVPRGDAETRSWRAGGLRMLFEHGFHWRDRVLQLDPAPAAPHPLQRLGLVRSAWVSPSLPLEQQLEQLRRHAAAFLVGTPTLLRRICGALEQRRIPVPPARTVLCQGEILDPESRDVVERTFGCRPASVYGTTEVGYVAWQCEEHDALHVNDELVAVEILDEHARPVAPGTIGRVVITDLRGRTMPLLRWDTGDLATAAAAPCPCGRTLSSIGAIEGRASQTLELPGGRRVTPRRVLDAMADVLPVDHYRLTQRGERRFTLSVTPGSETGIERAVTELRRLLGDVDIGVERTTWPAGVEKTHVIRRCTD
jgi:phenylacetate-CoA ligase